MCDKGLLIFIVVQSIDKDSIAQRSHWLNVTDLFRQNMIFYWSFTKGLHEKHFNIGFSTAKSVYRFFALYKRLHKLKEKRYERKLKKKRTERRRNIYEQQQQQQHTMAGKSKEVKGKRWKVNRKFRRSLGTNAFE